MTTPAPPHLTSTNPLDGTDRRVRLMGAALRALATVAPGASARVAEALFVKTARPDPRPHEATFLATAERFRVRGAGQWIAGYQWGQTGPVVLCAHGWRSHAGRFAPIATALCAVGFRVVAFDAPGHGQSTGWRATMPEFARAMRAVADHVGPVHATVGHSLGGSASLFALAHGLPATRAVVIASPMDIESWALRFRDAFRLPPRIYARMQRNLEARLGLTLAEIEVPRLAATLTVPGLVVHCTDDPDVPVEEAHTLARAWPASTLHVTSGLGHRAVMRDPDVVRRVVEFVGESGVRGEG